jgi:hypothetical protein
MKALNTLLFGTLFAALLVCALAPNLAIKAGGSLLFITAIFLSTWTTRKRG